MKDKSSEKIDIFGKTQVGPAKVLKIEKLKQDEFTVHTNLGNFFINKNTYPDIVIEDGELIKPHFGYSYVFDVESNSIVDVAMSTVDLLIFYKNVEKLQLLAIKRGHPPFVGLWANPGGNIDENETPIQAAVRELEEETSIKMDASYLKFVGRFDKPWRDPRSKMCVSYAFVCIVNEKPATIAQDDADDVTWLDIEVENDKVLITKDGEAVQMAFDHAEIVEKSINA